MKLMFPAAALAALAFGCSHGSANTRTAANDSGTTSPNTDSSMNGGQPTAGTVATNTQGTSAASNGSTANNAVPTDSATSNSNSNPVVGSTTSSGTPAPGSVAANNGTSSYGNAAASPSSPNNGTSSYGNAAASPSSPTSGTSSPNFSSSGVASMSNGSPNGTNSPGAPGSAQNDPTAGAKDDASLRTVTGSVAKIDSNSITLDQSAGGVTLTVDSSTQIMHRGKAVTAGISAIHEGQQIRAKFDPASNRADKIEVMGMKKHHKDAAATTPAPQ